MKGVFRRQECVMATDAVVPKPDEYAAEAPKAGYVKKACSPEYPAEQRH
jgi:hypothetical protein